MHKAIAYSFFLLLLIFLLACNPIPVFDANQNIPENGWSYDEPVSFDFSINDTTQTFDLFLIITHRDSYGYENLYLKIETIFPDNARVEDLLSIEMMNDVGQWLSRCRNDDCTLQVFLQDNIFFKQAGDYKITFSQYSREDTLAGISKLQFKILPAT